MKYNEHPPKRLEQWWGKLVSHDSQASFTHAAISNCQIHTEYIVHIHIHHPPRTPQSNGSYWETLRTEIKILCFKKLLHSVFGEKTQEYTCFKRNFFLNFNQTFRSWRYSSVLWHSWGLCKALGSRAALYKNQPEVMGYRWVTQTSKKLETTSVTHLEKTKQYFSF